jgi:hypothetical protein
MKTRWKILIGIIAFVGVATLLLVMHHFQLKAAVNRYKAELKAKGEPMELAQVIPPPVPSEQNSADALREADASFNEAFGADKSLLETNYVSGMKMVAPATAMVRWQQPDIRDFDGTNSWENVTAAVVQNAKAFALLQRIIEKPAFGFQIQYDRGVADLNFTNFYLSQSKRQVQRLEAAVLSDLHRGDTAAAMNNLRAMLALVKAMSDERFEISQLVRIAMASFALNASWELLESTNLTEEQLAALQHDWMSLDFIRGYENALTMERATGEITLTKWRSSNAELQHYFDIGRAAEESLNGPGAEETFFDKTKMATKAFLWRYWWSYSDELRYLKGYQALLDTPRFAETNHSFKAALDDQAIKLNALGIDKLGDGFEELLHPEKMDMHAMLSQSVLSLSGVIRKVMRVEVAKQTIITAIALKRYQLKHGKYPVTLDSLMPKFLASIPLDPVDGEPLRYRLNADGTFLLYSIGENGKDDGGDPSLQKGVESSSFNWQNPHALDWVWPQPATEVEIQTYYEEQAKKAK